MNILLNIWFIPNFGIDGAAYTTLISEIIVCAFCMMYSVKYMKRRINSLKILKMIVASGLFIPIYFATETLKYNYMVVLAIQVAACIMVYYTALRIMGIDPRKELKIE